MPEPRNASVPIAASHERRNVFLTSDGACDVSQLSDARRDADPTWQPATDPAGTQIEAPKRDPGRHGNRLAHTRHGAHPPAVPGARSAAALAVVVAAAMLGFALAQPDQRPRRAGEGGRPATVAPTDREPLDVPRLHGGAEAAKPKRAPAPRTRSRLKPTPRPAARRAAPRRARPSPPTPVTPPAPSPSLAPVPSPAPTSPTGRRPPTLPAPVPPGTPPEFM